MGRDYGLVNINARRVISIHAPRMGRDSRASHCSLHVCDFNPRAPYGARLAPALQRDADAYISIHAPRMGRDSIRARCSILTGRFQSTRPVWGATFIFFFQHDEPVIFQSTRPVWGATKIIALLCSDAKISIHAPRMGRDPPISTI